MQRISPREEPSSAGEARRHSLRSASASQRSSAMSETKNLPVLPLADEVVLPGMVAPITLDSEAQAAVDAARSAADGKLVLVPRVNGAYNADGVVATIEQVGRLPSGEPAAVLRGLRRARI